MLFDLCVFAARIVSIDRGADNNLADIKFESTRQDPIV
jgi:hypothetical protein